mgnify:FL=1
MKGMNLDKAVFFGGIGLLVFSCNLHGTLSAIVGLAGIVLCCYKWQTCFGTKAERRAKKEAQKVQAEIEAAQERKEIMAAHNPIKAKIIVSNTSKKAGSAAIRTAIGSSIAGLPGAVYGAASAKSKTSVTFYVTYEDGHSGTETVKSDSSRFLKLMKVCKD